MEYGRFLGFYISILFLLSLTHLLISNVVYLRHLSNSSKGANRNKSQATLSLLFVRTEKDKKDKIDNVIKLDFIICSLD